MVQPTRPKWHYWKSRNKNQNLIALANCSFITTTHGAPHNILYNIISHSLFDKTHLLMLCMTFEQSAKCVCIHWLLVGKRSPHWTWNLKLFNLLALLQINNKNATSHLFYKGKIQSKIFCDGLYFEPFSLSYGVARCSSNFARNYTRNINGAGKVKDIVPSSQS